MPSLFEFFNDFPLDVHLSFSEDGKSHSYNITKRYEPDLLISA